VIHWYRLHELTLSVCDEGLTESGGACCSDGFVGCNGLCLLVGSICCPVEQVLCNGACVDSGTVCCPTGTTVCGTQCIAPGDGTCVSNIVVPPVARRGLNSARCDFVFLESCNKSDLIAARSDSNPARSLELYETLNVSTPLATLNHVRTFRASTFSC